MSCEQRAFFDRRQLSEARQRRQHDQRAEKKWQDKEQVQVAGASESWGGGSNEDSVQVRKCRELSAEYPTHVEAAQNRGNGNQECRDVARRNAAAANLRRKERGKQQQQEQEQQESAVPVEHAKSEDKRKREERPGVGSASDAQDRNSQNQKEGKRKSCDKAGSGSPQKEGMDGDK